MFMRKIVFVFTLLFVFLGSRADQPPPRVLEARRARGAVKIDGLLSDSAWKEAALLHRLVEFRPKIGAMEEDGVRTEAYLMYSDEGIYFGGFCHERTRDSISYELKGRDGFGMNDYVGIILDTYNDKLNGFEYFVTPLNEQWDAKMAPGGDDNGGEDFSWNGVWQSGAVLHENGWSFEMFIPYGAIRFGQKDVQDWGLNITRRRRKTEQQYTWNPIDPNVNGFLTQEGLWKGIKDIKPPVRLQFSPYFSVYANHFPSGQPGQKDFTSQVNGGMDLKYGINQAFTLDMTLIPDFGQVQSDNQVLNLTPFEVQFNENRNFFTEGTELFGKGGLFYSRRIGGTPIHLYDVYDNLQPGESVIRNPSEARLLNATKISGRAQSGLGIGFLNAVSRPQYATIETEGTKAQREYLTSPLTNYNILVLDQTMKHNSSISLVNTNVWRSGSDYDANVTAGLFDLNNKKNMWNFGGKLAVSQLLHYIPDGSNSNGYSHRFYGGKTSGRFNFNVWQELSDTKYTHNDLGYFTNNNYLDHGIWVGYRWTEPRAFYNRVNLNFNGRVSRLYKRIGNLEPAFQNMSVGMNLNVQMKKLHWFGLFTNFSPTQNDFYEPRVTGYYFRRGASVAVGGWFESNRAKKYSVTTEAFVRRFIDFYNLTGVDLFFGQEWRVNQKFSLGHNLGLMPRFNSMGFATMAENGRIIFGRRRVNTVENVLNTKYSFNNRMGLTFRLRHYYSSVMNSEYYDIVQASGLLTTATDFTGSADRNVNFFNIDMVYTWQFAPGSFINLVWKNAISDFKGEVVDGYLRNLGDVLAADQNNNISLKVIYFLDYLQVRKWGHAKKA
jgi:hypothetical protein